MIKYDGLFGFFLSLKLSSEKEKVQEITFLKILQIGLLNW